MTSSGVTYTRWGRTSCPNDTEAQLVYSGRAGGTNYLVRGGSAEKSCLPDDPDYISGSVDLNMEKSVVQGAEFEISNEVHYNTYTSTMHHVLSVMFLPELKLLWCQLKPCVHRPGPESSMATS